MRDAAGFATSAPDQVEQAKATIPLERAFLGPQLAHTLNTLEFRELIAQIQQAQRGLDSTLVAGVPSPLSNHELELLQTFARSLQECLVGSPANVQHALASFAHAWSSIEWPKMRAPQLKQVASLIPKVGQLAETYRDVAHGAGWPEGVQSTAIEARLLASLEQLKRKVVSMSTQVKRIAGGQTTPLHLVFPSGLSAIRLKWSLGKESRRVSIVCGRRVLPLSLERAEYEVLLRLAWKMSQDKRRYNQYPDQCGWVSQARLIRWRKKRSGSEDAALGYLRKTVCDLRKKLAKTLQELGCLVDGQTVIQQKPHPTLKQNSYRLSVPPNTLRLPKLPRT